MDDEEQADRHSVRVGEPTSPLGMETAQAGPAADAVQADDLQATLATIRDVCHDLTQPMQAASGYAHLLLLRAAEDDPAYDMLKKMKEQMDRAAEISQQLSAIICAKGGKRRKGP